MGASRPFGLGTKDRAAGADYGELGRQEKEMSMSPDSAGSYCMHGTAAVLFLKKVLCVFRAKASQAKEGVIRAWGYVNMAQCPPYRGAKDVLGCVVSAPGFKGMDNGSSR